MRKARGAAPAGLLVVDVGNSETVIGHFAGEDLVSHWRIGSRPRTADEVSLLLRSLAGTDGAAFRGLGSVLCSGVPPATRDFAAALARLTRRAPLIVDHRTAGIPVRYRDPSAVGPDRIANAVAARALYGTPAIVVDLGTATTFDVVGKRGDYLGGAIAPGVVTASEELYRRASRLPASSSRSPPTPSGGRRRRACSRASCLAPPASSTLWCGASRASWGASRGSSPPAVWPG